MCLCALVMVYGYLIQHTEYALNHLQVSEVIIYLRFSSQHSYCTCTVSSAIYLGAIYLVKAREE